MQPRVRTKKKLVAGSPAATAAASSAAASAAASSAAAASSSSSASSSSADPGALLASLVSRAERCVDEQDWEGARALFSAALREAPEDVSLLDAAGEAAFQAGDGGAACALYSRSLELCPGGPNFTRHMYLGLLGEGAAALAHYERGVASLRALLAEAEGGGAEGADRAALLRRELSKAHCSAAELFMTDLCDEPGAEEACEAQAAAALAADAACAEAHRVLADLRLCQKRVPESAALITRSVQLMEACYPPEGSDGEEEEEGEEEGEEGEGEGGAARAEAAARRRGGMPVEGSSSAAAADTADTAGAVPALLSGDPTAALPSRDARLRAAQIALECCAWEPAACVCERLLAEEDSDMHVWFLLGEALLGGGELQAAEERLGQAEALLEAAIARVAEAARAELRARTAAGARPGGGGGGARAAAAAAAAAAAPRGDASDHLFPLGRTELEAQRKRIRELRAVVARAMAAAAEEEAGESAMG